jgi:flagellar biosynthesis/type III secretory pathway chaperone
MNITKTARDQYRRRKQIEKRANELQDEMDKLQNRWEKLGDQIGEDRLAELNEENGLSRGYEFRDVLA